MTETNKTVVTPEQRGVAMEKIATLIKEASELATDNQITLAVYSLAVVRDEGTELDDLKIQRVEVTAFDSHEETTAEVARLATQGADEDDAKKMTAYIERKVSEGAAMADAIDALKTLRTLGIPERLTIEMVVKPLIVLTRQLMVGAALHKMANGDRDDAVAILDGDSRATVQMFTKWAELQGNEKHLNTLRKVSMEEHMAVGLLSAVSANGRHMAEKSRSVMEDLGEVFRA